MGVAPSSPTYPASGYTLFQTFDSTNFFNEFSFFAGADPTHGYVDYVSQSAAQSSNLAYYANNQVYLGVDTTTYNPTRGRQSMRLTNNLAFATECGVWPAFWMFGPNWPTSGEIDIIERVNNQATNSITLHTSPSYVVSNANSQFGTYTTTTDCNSDNANKRYTTRTSNPNNFRASFNSIGSGTYAIQWASSRIYI